MKHINPNAVRSNGFILIAFVFSILLFVCILVNRNPFLIRQTSILLRFGFTITIPLVFLVLALGFRPSGWACVCTAMLTTLVLLALDLNGLWASGQSESVVISGLLPWSDANNYYMDALAWLEGFKFSEMSSMRPLFASFLSFILSITGQNLQVSVALLVLIVGLSSFIFGQKVKESHGFIAAAMTLLIVFFYYRRLAGTTMTENISLALSLLGFALLWIGIQKKGKTAAIFGVFLIALSLMSRPGPFFILPMLILWNGWSFKDSDGKSRKGSISMILFSSLGVILAFGMNSVIQMAVSDGNTLPFGNFSYALYGLASGGNGYTQIFADHPELKQLAGNERFFSIFQVTFELIKQNPGNLVVGISKHLKDFLFPATWYGIFGFIDGDSAALSTISRSILEILSVVCLYSCIRQKNDPYRKLILFMMIGTILSVPFVPPGDAHKLRLYSAVIPVIGLLPAFGLDQVIRLLRLPVKNCSTVQCGLPNQACGIFSILLVVLLAVSPWMSRVIYRPAGMDAIRCPEGLVPFYFHFAPGSYVSILEDQEFFLDWLPNFHASRFRKSIHGLPDKRQMSAFLGIRAGNHLIGTIDISTGKSAWVIIDQDLLPKQGSRYLGVCVQKEDRLFKVVDVIVADK